MNRIAIGILIVGLIVAGVGSGFLVADYSYQKGYSSGYSSGNSIGKEAGYADGYQNAKEKYMDMMIREQEEHKQELDILFKQGFFAGYCEYHDYNRQGWQAREYEGDSTATICSQFTSRYMMPYYAGSEEYTGFFMCNSQGCQNVYYYPPTVWKIEDPEA